jgi:penicillin-binding protein 1A
MTHRERQLRRRRRRKGLPGALLALVVLGITAAIAGLAVVGYVVAIAASAPDLDELKPQDAGETSVVFAADGSRLGFVQSDIIRTPIESGDIPDTLREATVAIEDERFYEHEGIDYGAIIRAGIKNLSTGDTVQGGSTISQQLVRALYIEDPDESYARKIREAKLASELEDERSKEWILREYLNSVPYGTVNGRTALGIEAASEVFFSEHARDLKLHEAALLAGLPQAPSRYNPLREGGAALGRRNTVLRSMAENGFITTEEAEAASQRPLGLDPNDTYTERREPYFFDYVQDVLIDEYGVEKVRQGGLEIHTTIDPELQEAGRHAIDGRLGYPSDPAAAVVAIDPSNGDIKAMASSGSYDDRTFNLAAQGHRQPGSAFKPMVLTAAVRQGIDPDATTYVSKPLSLDLPEYGHWEVETYSQSYGGAMTLTEGTLESDNTVYAQLILDVGPDKVKETSKLLGIESPLDGLPAEGLGGMRVGVSPLEMARAYATLASGGIRREAQGIERVEFPNGDVDKFGQSEGQRVLSDGEAYEVTKILSENIQSGTGTSANIGCAEGTAGKTGTTDDFRDAWFVGYTPDLATSVWVGYPDAQTSMSSVHGISVAGGTFPAEIWHDFMVVANDECTSFPAPTDPAQLSAFESGYANSGTTTEPTSPAPAPSPSPGQYDPLYYESPPQPAPDPVAPAPAPAPPEPEFPSPGGGGGNSGPGGGGGGGNGELGAGGGGPGPG